MTDHGTVDRYDEGCRCSPCIIAKAKTDRPVIHAPQRRRSIFAKTELAVTCWCEATVVGVTKTEIHAGRTRSCGRAGCVAA